MIRFLILLCVPFLHAAAYAIGDYAEGGIVFWLDPSGHHGLVAAIVDQDDGTGANWYNETYTNTNAYANGPYLGAVNTTTIANNEGMGTYAATLASNYSVTVAGITYGNWYLPSQIELALLYQMASTINTAAIANGGNAFASDMYWSSNESSEMYAFNQDFVAGGQNGDDKSTNCRVRAIRIF